MTEIQYKQKYDLEDLKMWKQQMKTETKNNIVRIMDILEIKKYFLMKMLKERE